MTSKRDMREAAETIGRLIDAAVRGDLDAPPAMLARLDGAQVALATVAEPERRPPRRPLAKD